MAQRQLLCDCDVIHEDVVNHVREHMPDKKDFAKLLNLLNIIPPS